MGLAIGAQLDHYEIVERIGVGGMGEVFRARDTRLPREVAIKVSSQAFNERFARETKVIASLNHPNICTLFDVGPNYLVMELVDGVTLQEHIKQGPMSLEEASRIARPIADALDYAHEHGVIHRDLKPANIKVRPDGVVKVLDFGLAKAVQAANPDDVATVTLGATQAGAILGTPNYMSPEQATGRPTDKRSDTWAFGIVFYEMLAGGKPFGGSTIQETIAATLRDAPDLSKVPPQARRLLRKCLEKDPANRLKHLGDVMSLLDEAPSVELATGPVAATPTGKKWMWPAVAAIGLLAAVSIGAMHFSERPVAPETIRFDFTAPPGMAFSRTGGFSLSPDGRSIVFAAADGTGGSTHLWIRRLDSTELRRLDFETSPDPFPPVWSPDSRLILFEKGADVIKADIASGTTQRLCEKCQALGGAWGTNGIILLGNLESILRIPEAGGEPVALVTVDRKKGDAAIHPTLLPDGKHFLYLMISNATPNKAGLKVGSLDMKPDQQSKDWLVETGGGAAWIPPTADTQGQLLYVAGSSLMARTFDTASLSFRGEPVTVVNQVGYSRNWAWGLFSASATGHLVYRAASQTGKQQLTWFDREGKSLGTVGDPGVISNVTLSPDGKRAALTVATGSDQTDVWVADLTTGTRARLTFEPGPEAQPVWSPDGASIYYEAYRDERYGFYRRDSNGAGGEVAIHRFDAGDVTSLTDVSPDGRRLLFQRSGKDTVTDIWSIDVAPGAQPELVVQTPFQEVGAHFSRDGRWVAYRSNESGRPEIYVTAAPGSNAPPGKWLVSNGGTGMARFRRDGREISYLSPDGAVMAEDVVSAPAFHPSKPRKLFDVPPTFRALFASGVPGSLADVTPDGQRFLLAVPQADVGSPFTVVTNWQASSGK